MQGKGLRDRAPQLQDKDVVVLGASFDSVEDNCAFAQKFGFPYKLLSDTDKKVGELYGAVQPDKPGYAKRIAYLIDPQGKVKKVWEKVDTKAFADEVVASV